MKKHEVVEETKKLSKEEATAKAKKDMFLDIAPYLIIIFFIVVIRTFIATPITVNGSSMDPTLKDGDYMLLYKLVKTTRGIKRDDIVVIDTASGRLIKRVIGLPGDVITFKTETVEDEEVVSLYRNGKKVKEKYISQKAINDTCKDGWEICNSELKIPEDEYYVLGDNRGNSKDSRMIGTVSYDEIIGTTELVFFPFNRIGFKK